MTENYNGKGLYWNYNYHVWKTFSISPFNQAVAFSDVASSITAVAVSPKAATLPRGADLAIEATVTGTGVINKGVQWTLAGNASSGSYVSDAGKVHVRQGRDGHDAYRDCNRALPGRHEVGFRHHHRVRIV